MSLTESILAVAFVVTLYLLWKRTSQISAERAVAYLRDGALLIDVRSPAEFNSRHLPNAINLPVEKIETTLPRRVSDKNQMLLLHCQSGMRSGVAKTKLAGLGYVKAFNLGSYARAAKIVNAR
jgi:phage shock protein E